jgi:hypothetical protein
MFMREKIRGDSVRVMENETEENTDVLMRTMKGIKVGKNRS